MSNEMFEALRRRMTFIYAAIFGFLILVIVGAAYFLIWQAILTNEREALIAKIYHEAEEWVNSGEPPCSETTVADGSMLAYFVTADGQTVILNQLGDGAQGRALWRQREYWPQDLEGTRLIRMKSMVDGQHLVRYRYLAGVAPVRKGNETVGLLYMFKNIEFYYNIAYTTLFLLLCLGLLLFIAACSFGYWLAGRNIRPISEMYERQRQFTADASHEMRTPLAVMRLAADGLKEDTDSSYSDFAKESLTMLEHEVTYLKKLTEDLMELARSDNGTLPPPTQQVELSKVCLQVLEQLALLAARKQIVLNSAIAEGLQVRGDEQSLQRLLVLLVDNAVKYSPAESVVSVSLLKHGDRLRLEVRDEGCGISAADKEKVFDRFYRVDKARSRSEGGLGLGLALALAIVKQHRGTIKILDNELHGTIFRVELPC